MKKLFIICFFLQAQCLLFAQSKDTLLNAINTGVSKLVTPLRVNDHLCVFLTDNHHKKYELTAVNDSPAVAWHTQITGNVLSAGLFKNHIIVVIYAARSLRHGKAHDFSALIFDPVTGRQTGQKVFYSSDTGKYERAFSFNMSENNFRLVVKDEGLERRKYHNFDKPTFFSHTTPFYILPRYAITHQVQVFNYNEQLEVTSVDNFAVKGGLIGYNFDKKGDLMVAMFNDNDIQADKFVAGKNTAADSIKLGLSLTFSLGRRNTPGIMVTTSPDGSGVLFYVIGTNTRTDAEFRLGKVNFADKRTLLL